MLVYYGVKHLFKSSSLDFMNTLNNQRGDPWTCAGGKALQSLLEEPNKQSFSEQSTRYCQKYWHPLLMKDLTTLVISMSTNLNV